LQRSAFALQLSPGKRHATSLMREILEVHAATLVAQEQPLTFPG
jgi:hypothetical protein